MEKEKKSTILLVDDEDEIRGILKTELKCLGCTIHEASSGTEALEVLKNNKIDLVLSDVRMPDGSGIKLLDQIKDLDINLSSFLFMTGNSDLTEEEAYQRGADGFFSKPFDPEYLVLQVKNFLAGRKNLWSSTEEQYGLPFTLRQEFPSVDQAQKNRELVLGRGGFFLNLTGTFPKVGQKFEFSFQFKKGDCDTLKGKGINRWVRNVKSKDLPTGCGVEIRYLDESCREQIVTYLKDRQMRPFIPNGS